MKERERGRNGGKERSMDRRIGRQGGRERCMEGDERTS